MYDTNPHTCITSEPNCGYNPCVNTTPERLREIAVEAQAEVVRLQKFETAWAAKVAWGSHALQHPCVCECAVSNGATCSVGRGLKTECYRTASIANGLLGGPADV